MEKGDEWEDSQCLDVWLHRYEFYAEWSNCVMEVCQLCGDEQYYTICDNGVTDNLAYLSHNLRLALPANHPLATHEYYAEI